MAANANLNLNFTIDLLALGDKIKNSMRDPENRKGFLDNLRNAANYTAKKNTTCLFLT
jgi:hypothetical protein